MEDAEINKLLEEALRARNRGDEAAFRQLVARARMEEIRRDAKRTMDWVPPAKKE